MLVKNGDEMELKQEWFVDAKHMLDAQLIVQESAEAARSRFLEEFRRNCAEKAMNYRRDAKRFGDSGQYATAETMRCCAEAYGLICLDIGRILGLSDRESLRVVAEY